MEIFVNLIIPTFLVVSTLRLFLAPLRLTLKLLINGGVGLVCLWLTNLISGFTGIIFPINMVTILIAGFFGLPGIGLLALIQQFL